MDKSINFKNKNDNETRRIGYRNKVDWGGKLWTNKTRDSYRQIPLNFISPTNRKSKKGQRLYPKPGYLTDLASVPKSRFLITGIFFIQWDHEEGGKTLSPAYPLDILFFDI